MKMSNNGNVISLTDRANYINDWVQNLFTEENWALVRLTRAEIQKLSAIDCAEIAFILRQQALFVQMKINKISACVLSLNHDMNMLIAPKMKDYDKYVKFEERRLLATRENDVLVKMSSQLNDLEQKKEALEYLGQRLENLSIAMNDIRRTKYEYNQTKSGY
jgi:hypothetical protein